MIMFCGCFSTIILLQNLLLLPEHCLQSWKSPNYLTSLVLVGDTFHLVLSTEEDAWLNKTFKGKVIYSAKNSVGRLCKKLCSVSLLFFRQYIFFCQLASALSEFASFSSSSLCVQTKYTFLFFLILPSSSQQGRVVVNIQRNVIEKKNIEWGYFSHLQKVLATYDS